MLKVRSVDILINTTDAIVCFHYLFVDIPDYNYFKYIQENMKHHRDKQITWSQVWYKLKVNLNKC